MKSARRAALASRALAFLLLLAPAFLLRMVAAFTWAREPVWDAHYYDFGARRIAVGLGYSDDRVVRGITEWHPWCHYPVGYSGFLALAYKAFGTSALTAHIANALVSALLVVLVASLARRSFGRIAACLAGVTMCLHPGLILYSALLMSEPLAALLTLSAIAIATYRVDAAAGPRSVGVDITSPAWKRFAPLGIACLVLGLSTLVRPQALLCAPFIGVAAFPTLRTGKRAIAERLILGPLLAVGMTLLPVVPWTLRNCRVMDGCALVSTNAGWNLAIGSFPRATGRFESLRSTDGCRDVTGQVQQDRCWLEYGKDAIRADVGRWIALMPKKLSFTFDHESYAVEYLHEASPSNWPEDRRQSVRTALTRIHRALLVLSGVGGILFAIRSRQGSRSYAQLRAVSLLCVAAYVAIAYVLAERDVYWPLIFATLVPLVPVVPVVPLVRDRFPPMAPSVASAFVLTLVVTHAIFFGEDRYHIVVTPVLIYFAAGAVSMLGALAHGKRVDGPRSVGVDAAAGPRSIGVEKAGAQK